METLPPGLAPHKGLRGQVLLELKRHQPLTVKELADRADLTDPQKASILAGTARRLYNLK